MFRNRSLDWWVGFALATLSVLATIELTLQISILLMLTLVLAPIALAMVAAPTALMWVGPGLAAFLLARRLGRGIGLAGICAVAALVLTLAILTAIPLLANANTAAQVRARAAEAFPSRVAIAPVETVVAMRPSSDVDENGSLSLQCEWRCERALLSGFTQRYAIGLASEFDRRATLQKVGVVHEIVPIAQGCNNALLLGARAEDGDFPVQTHRNQLYLRDALNGSGRCFRSRRVTRASGDVVIVEQRDLPPGYGRRPPPLFDWRLNRIREERLAIYSRGSSGLQFRSRFVHVGYEPLEAPLRLAAPFVFTTFTPGGWGHEPAVSSGTQLPLELSELFASDFKVDYAPGT